MEYVIVEMHRSKDNKFYWIVKAKNGLTLLTSETYNREQSLRKSVERFVECLCDYKIKNYI